MRVFVSYASVDRLICQRIIDMLDEAHTIWYDKHIDIGQKWWSVIVRRILWADAFIFLISPRSIKSIHCKKEFQIAVKKRKKIFPILIEEVKSLPSPLCDYNYIDMSPKADTTDGLTIENIMELHNSMVRYERTLWNKRIDPPVQPFDGEEDTIIDLQEDFATTIEKIVESMAEEEYDNAIYRIDYALRKGWQWELYDLQKLRDTALRLLHAQQYQIQAQAQYDHIKRLASRDKTLQLAVAAYNNFRQLYPDFPDTDGLALRLTALIDPLPTMEWCNVSEGHVGILYKNRRYVQYVDAFRISKYPITNAQFDVFIHAEDGYANTAWWGFSKEACEWRMNNPKPITRRARDLPEHPRVNVSWYEARAFCNWLGHQLQVYVALPTEQEWQRAAQGDDNRRYPWGNTHKSAYCNGRASGVNRTTPVKGYPDGKSPFGVFGMSGNVWEWTLSADEAKKIRIDQPNPIDYRITKGGSCSSDYLLLRCTSRLSFDPASRFGTIGFRVIIKMRPNLA